MEAATRACRTLARPPRPPQLQDEIENTTIQFQRIGQATLNLQKENVTAITRQLQARVTGTITVLNATFAANATLIDATAKAAVLNLTSVAEASSYNAFKTGFGLTNQQVRQVCGCAETAAAPACGVACAPLWRRS